MHQPEGVCRYELGLQAEGCTGGLEDETAPSLLPKPPQSKG